MKWFDDLHDTMDYCQLYYDAGNIIDCTVRSSVSNGCFITIQSNSEIQFIRKYLTINDCRIDSILGNDREMMLFIYDSLRILVDQNYYRAGSLKIFQEQGEEDNIVFVYKPVKEKTTLNFYDFSSHKYEGDLYNYLLKSLFKKSKRLRHRLVIDERV